MSDVLTLIYFTLEKPSAKVTQRSRRGPPGPRKYDWLAIAGEIARRCHDKSGHLSVPDKESDLVNDMLQWCSDHLGKEPSLTEMKEAVKRICAALSQV